MGLVHCCAESDRGPAREMLYHLLTHNELAPTYSMLLTSPPPPPPKLIVAYLERALPGQAPAKAAPWDLTPAWHRQLSKPRRTLLFTPPPPPPHPPFLFPQDSSILPPTPTSGQGDQVLAGILQWISAINHPYSEKENYRHAVLQGCHEVCQNTRMCTVRLRAGQEGPGDAPLPGQVPGSFLRP